MVINNGIPSVLALSLPPVFIPMRIPKKRTPGLAFFLIGLGLLPSGIAFLLLLRPQFLGWVFMSISCTTMLLGGIIMQRHRRHGDD